MFKKTPVAFLILLISAQTALAQVSLGGEKFADPTRPLRLLKTEAAVRPATRMPNTAVFAVGFVRVSETSSIAVINDEQVTVGSLIDGAEVLAISRSGVTLRVGDETRVIAPFSSIVTQ